MRGEIAYSALLKLASAEAWMRRIPKEKHTALWQTACHPDQLPLLPLARVEQLLNRGLKTHLWGRGHQLGVVTTVRRLAPAADLSCHSSLTSNSHAKSFSAVGYEGPQLRATYSYSIGLHKNNRGAEGYVRVRLSANRTGDMLNVRELGLAEVRFPRIPALGS